MRSLYGGQGWILILAMFWQFAKPPDFPRYTVVSTNDGYISLLAQQCMFHHDSHACNVHVRLFTCTCRCTYKIKCIPAYCMSKLCTWCIIHLCLVELSFCFQLPLVCFFFFFLFQSHQYRDFLSHLPKALAHRVLMYVPSKDILRHCCRVRQLPYRNTDFYPRMPEP